MMIFEPISAIDIDKYLNNIKYKAIIVNKKVRGLVYLEYSVIA